MEHTEMQNMFWLGTVSFWEELAVVSALEERPVAHTDYKIFWYIYI